MEHRPAQATLPATDFAPTWLKACARELMCAGNLGEHEAHLAARTALQLYGDELREDPAGAAARMLEEG